MKEMLKFMKWYLTKREKETTLAEDLKLIKNMTQKEGYTYNLRFAIIFRAEKKKIIHSQVKLVELGVSMLERIFKLQSDSDHLNEAQIKIEFDKLIMKKTEDELTEETEEPYFLRRLYMRDYLRELRTVVLTHKNFNDVLLHKAKVANLQNQ